MVGMGLATGGNRLRVPPNIYAILPFLWGVEHKAGAILVLGPA